MRVLLWLLLPPLLFITFACGGDAAAPGEEAPAEGVYLNHAPDAEYVGRDACQGCHPDKFESFVASEMGRSFKPATLTNSVADFDAPAPLYDPHADLYYQPFHRGEALFVREYRLQGRDTVHQRVEQIDYIIGSGQHTNSHLRQENGYVYQIPVTWYVQQGKWGLAPGFGRSGQARFDRAIEVECMACHNGFPDYVEGSGNRYRHVPEGIGCERCHGPGSIHIAQKQAGQIVDVSKEIDYSIVNPAKLSLDRQYDVCRRCHMQGMAALKPGKDFLDHRPGMPLDSVMNVFWPRFADSTQQFIMASHPDRLQMSACYQGALAEPSMETMTCVTCHDPHVSVKTQGRDYFNATCATCHDPAQDHVTCAAPPAARAAAGDDCTSCHMPTSGTADIPHITITDHYIRTPGEAAAPPSTGQVQTDAAFVRFASLIEAAPSARTVGDGYLTFYEQFRAQPQFLDSAAVYLERAAAARGEAAMAPSLIRLWFLQGRHGHIRRLAAALPEGALDAGPEVGWTHYRIGEAYTAAGRHAQAVAAYEQAVAHAPDRLDFLRKLADAYQSNQQAEAALATYDRLIAADGTRAEAYNNRGLTRLMMRDFEGAEADFKRTLALDPDVEQALGNLASLYYNTGRPAQARPLVARLITRHPGNTQYRQFLQLLGN